MNKLPNEEQLTLNHAASLILLYKSGKIQGLFRMAFSIDYQSDMVASFLFRTA